MPCPRLSPQPGLAFPSTVANLGGNLCQELERRLDVLYQLAREHEQRLAQLSATPSAVSREE